MLFLNDNGLGKLFIDIVATILDGHRAAASPAGYNGNGFAAVATKGKQESIQFFIVGLDTANMVFPADLCVKYIHRHYPLSKHPPRVSLS